MGSPTEEGGDLTSQEVVVEAGGERVEDEVVEVVVEAEGEKEELVAMMTTMMISALTSDPLNITGYKPYVQKLIITIKKQCAH